MFQDLIVKTIRGVPVYFSEIARIADGYEEQRTLALINGQRALALEIRKQSGSNTVDVAEAVKEALPALNRELPGQTRLDVVRDSSEFIRDAVDDVKTTLVLGAIFTVFIVFLFLNSWRSTVITGLTLPVSIISAFIIMRIMGFSLNMLTLMGLSLSVGLLIDDAIVVRENIVRHMQFGRDHFEAARIGHLGNRARRDGNDVFHHRGLCADRLHEGDRRALLFMSSALRSRLPSWFRCLFPSRWIRCFRPAGTIRQSKPMRAGAGWRACWKRSTSALWISGMCMKNPSAFR